MMTTKNRLIVCVLSFTLFLGLIPAGEVSAVKKVSLSNKKITVKEGKSKTLKVKNTKKKIKWKILSGKKYITLKKKEKAAAKITGKKKGTARVQAKTGGKKLTCKVVVKGAGKAASEPTGTLSPAPVASVAVSAGTAAPVIPVASSDVKNTSSPTMPSYAEDDNCDVVGIIKTQDGEKLRGKTDIEITGEKRSERTEVQDGEFHLSIAPGTYQIRVQNMDTEGFILTDSFVVEDTNEPQAITIVADVQYVKGKINLINHCNTDIDISSFLLNFKDSVKQETEDDYLGVNACRLGEDYSYEILLPSGTYNICLMYFGNNGWKLATTTVEDQEVSLDIDFIPYCIYGKLNISDSLSEKLSGASDFQLECFMKNAETYTGSHAIIDEDNNYWMILPCGGEFTFCYYYILDDKWFGLYTIDDISLGSTEYGKHMDLTITGNESEWS